LRAARLAKFDLGDAMALPFPADTFDAAIMALVLFFVPDPAKGVAEMTRLVRPGGMVAAYAWEKHQRSLSRLKTKKLRTQKKAAACFAANVIATTFEFGNCLASELIQHFLARGMPDMMSGYFCIGSS
jgi:ubiquinone/menaquinone biosynthesis C-methylase UbiE